VSDRRGGVQPAALPSARRWQAGPRDPVALSGRAAVVDSCGMRGTVTLAAAPIVDLLPLGKYNVTLELGGRRLTQRASITKTQGGRSAEGR
jgi:hypothetical protein